MGRDSDGMLREGMGQDRKGWDPGLGGDECKTGWDNPQDPREPLRIPEGRFNYNICPGWIAKIEEPNRYH